MPTYYVRQTGNDSSAGTSAGAAWRTIGKALGAAGISSGDTVYIGPGEYFESVAVAMTSAVAETFVLGDPLGEFTGDTPGEVVWSGSVGGPYGASIAGSGCPVNLNGRDFLTLRNITFLNHTGNANQGQAILGTTATSSDITISKCVFLAGRSSARAMEFTSAFNTALNVTVEDCIFVNQNMGVYLTATRGTGADYDLNVQVRRCQFIGLSNGVYISVAGAGVNYGGGVDVVQCTSIGPIAGMLRTTNAELSTTVPCTIQDCLAIGGVIATANTSGQVTDLGGNIGTTANTNVTSHATSRYDVNPPLWAFRYSMGHEWLHGLPMRKPGSLYPGYALLGLESAGTTGLDNSHSIFDGSGIFGDSGTCTSANTDDLSDSTKAWGVDQWKGWLLRITGGTGSGQVKRIASNTATELDISGAAPGGGLWSTTPSTDSTYIIYQGPPVETGKFTATTITTTSTDGGANWATNQWAGYTLEITAGTQSGQSVAITSNTATVLTHAALPGASDNTSVYSIYKDSLTAVQAAPGAIAAHDTAKKEETTTDSGTGIVIEGYGSHEFLIPVDATATTVSVRCRYDSNHGTTNKPQAILLANGEIGIATETETAAGAADAWETLTFSVFTPSAKGVVTIRLQARSDTPYGKCYFDTFTVTT